jgi:L-fucose isomerase-like protein
MWLFNYEFFNHGFANHGIFIYGFFNYMLAYILLAEKYEGLNPVIISTPDESGSGVNSTWVSEIRR